MATSRTRRPLAVRSKMEAGRDAVQRLRRLAARAVPRLVAGLGAVALVAAFVVATDSAAGATQSISAPSSGAAGSRIVITGAGWPGFDSVAAYLDQGSTHTFFCSFSSDASGNLEQVCTLPTALPQGAYSLVVTDNTLSANGSFTLNPSASVAVSSTGGAITSAARGETLFLNGFGFKGGSTITSVKIGSTSVTTTPAKPATTATGGFSGATFVVPSTLAAGTSTVTVTDAASHAATFPLNVYAATDTSPASGNAGKSLAVSGAGWPVGDSVAAYLVPLAGSPTFFCSIGTDVSGNLGPTLCTLPSTLTQGSYTLLLTDNSVTVTEAFTLNPGVSVAASSTGSVITNAAAGQTLFLSGAGFAGSSTITSVKVGAAVVTTVPATPATTAGGAISGVSFAIPKTAKAGLTPVTVTDASSHSAVLHLSVFKATDTSAASGSAGKSVAVSGAGWPASDSVAAYLVSGAGTATFFCSVGANTEGSVGPTLCTLPSTLTQGSYTLLLTDNSLSVVKPFTLNPGVVVQAASTTTALSSAAAGQTVGLSGVGFAGSSTIKSVKVGATAVTLTPASPPTSGTGTFSGVTFAIPTATAAGATTVTVTDAASHSATWHLTVYKATDTSASSGSAGKGFVVSGTGWPLVESVNAYLVQGSSQTFFCSISTDGAGNAGPSVCTLPSSLPQGSYTLLLTDGSIAVTKPFTLNPGTTLTNTSSQPINSAARGSTVDFSGAGFVAGGTIKTVTIGATKVATSPAAPALSLQGSFTGASFVVPSGLALGSDTVTITDSSGHKATAPLTVTS